MPHRVPGARGAPRRMGGRGGAGTGSGSQPLAGLSQEGMGRTRWGHLSELGLESFHRWARALWGSEEESLQLSLAAWGWGALGPVQV